MSCLDSRSCGCCYLVEWKCASSSSCDLDSKEKPRITLDFLPSEIAFSVKCEANQGASERASVRLTLNGEKENTPPPPPLLNAVWSGLPLLNNEGLWRFQMWKMFALLKYLLKVQDPENSWDKKYRDKKYIGIHSSDSTYHPFYCFIENTPYKVSFLCSFVVHTWYVYVQKKRLNVFAREFFGFL